MDPKNNKKDNLSRRGFVATTGAVAVGAAVGACSKNDNPLAPNAENKPVNPTPGDTGALPKSDPKLATVSVATYNNYEYEGLKNQIIAMVDAVGGLGDICKAGDTVGFKINMTGGDGNAKRCPSRYGVPASDLYWTHPTILKIALELFRDAGAGKLLVFEAIYDQASYRDYGYKDVVDEIGAEFIDLNKPEPYSDFLEVDVPSPLGTFDKYKHNGALYDCNCFVSLPKGKRHWGGGVTGAMKMMVGSIPMQYYRENSSQQWRPLLHTSNIKNLPLNFTDINKIRPIHFTIIDMIKTAKNGEGPWNTGFGPKVMDKLVVGKDPVASDAIMTVEMGHDPMADDGQAPWGGDLEDHSGKYGSYTNYLRRAEAEGMGIHDPSKIEVIDASLNTGVAHRG